MAIKIEFCGGCLQELFLTEKKKNNKNSPCAHLFHRICWQPPERCPACGLSERRIREIGLPSPKSFKQKIRIKKTTAMRKLDFDQKEERK